MNLNMFFVVGGNKTSHVFFHNIFAGAKQLYVFSVITAVIEISKAEMKKNKKKCSKQIHT